MARKVLFIDRDGTLIREFPPTYQIDDFSKVSFYPEVFQYMVRIARELDYELVLVTNQDGLGTDAFPEENFWGPHNLIMSSFASEGVIFKEELIDRSFPHENKPTRKPGVGMFTNYLGNPEYDIENSYVIGDRITDVQLAKNLGCKAIWLCVNPDLGGAEVKDNKDELMAVTPLITTSWKDIYEFLRLGQRKIFHTRNTKETAIEIILDLDGTGTSTIETGIGFFDHMLDQIARHGQLDLSIKTKGDLHIDSHHAIEDTGIALGEAFRMAIGNKMGMERYGFSLPMDEAEASVLLDFGGRPWLVWNLWFSGTEIGEIPSDLFHHFFKSFCDTSGANLNIAASGVNDHHKIEAVFKAFAKAVRMAVQRNPYRYRLPSTKGKL